MSFRNENMNAEESVPIHSFRLRIILVRHGESENDIHHEISLQAFEDNRVPDPSMTDRGMQQAQHVARYFQKGENDVLKNIRAIYVSPMLRTLQTADPIANALKMKPIVWTHIYEISGIHNRGIGQGGMSRSEMKARFPDYQLPESVTESGWYDIELGRESRQHGKMRVQDVWEQLIQMGKNLSSDRVIMMVVHGDFIDHLLQAALEILEMEDEPYNASITGSDPHLIEKHQIFPTWNASITALDLYVHKSRKPTILFHNAVNHLPSDMVKTHKLGQC